MGCTHVIIGHSERRQIFAETDEFIHQKVLSALEHGLTPIICVGETLEERQAGKTGEVVTAQLTKALEGLSGDVIADLIIAYEPVWAIGTGVSAKAGDAQKTIYYLRRWIADNYDEATAADVRIQYGGSVKPDNIKEYMRQPDIDGALIGGAGLEADSFSRIIQNAAAVY